MQEQAKTKIASTLQELAEIIEEKEFLLRKCIHVDWISNSRIESQEKYLTQIKELEKRPERPAAASKHQILQAGAIKQENIRLQEVRTFWKN